MDPKARFALECLGGVIIVSISLSRLLQISPEADPRGMVAIASSIVGVFSYLFLRWYYLFVRPNSKRHSSAEIKNVNWCKTCGKDFSKTTEKQYSLIGYCSTECFEKEESTPPKIGSSEYSFDYETIEETKLSTVEITCSNNHRFPVPATYSGCIRRCPVCDEKCEVP